MSSAQELIELWENYKIEKEEREKFRRAELDLDYNEQELLQILKRYQIKDPAVWLHQTEAILDHKEMVEKYPQYAKEIMASVEEYEKKFAK